MGGGGQWGVVGGSGGRGGLWGAVGGSGEWYRGQWG